MLRALTLFALLACASPAVGQVIGLKTVPVAQGDQFLIAPSQNLGMGGVSIALDDPLLDPFINPARGSRVSAAHVFALPTFYSLSDHAGSGRTLSTGALGTGRHAFGGVLVALQQVSRGDPFASPIFVEGIAAPPLGTLARRSRVNKYAVVALGTVTPGGLALAASASLADLRAVDGVDHLYALAGDVQASGHDLDVRLGALQGLAGGATLDAVVVAHRYAVTHEVTYLDWVVDSTTFQWRQQTRLEVNQDRSDTWGGELRYVRPVGEAGWRVGAQLTGNYKSHPKIPNYELVNIPRDPGHSTAFDVGVGVARVAGPTTFGLDVIYEPAWSHTWAEAAAPVLTAGGILIPVGGRTVDNDFTFSNAAVNVGVGHTIGITTLQLGLAIRAYDYDLTQQDLVAGSSRTQAEQWMEWTPSWGARLEFSGLTVRYLGRATTGTGRPGVAWDGPAVGRFATALAANDIVVAPSGPLTLQDITVVTHQISVSLPLR